MPDATYVIDIGSQDMKCLKGRQEGCIAGVTLNEACSAGCGAFLETFAQSLNLSMEEIRAGRALCPPSRESGLALHGVHEFKR